MVSPVRQYEIVKRRRRRAVCAPIKPDVLWFRYVSVIAMAFQVAAATAPFDQLSPDPKGEATGIGFGVYTEGATLSTPAPKVK